MKKFILIAIMAMSLATSFATNKAKNDSVLVRKEAVIKFIEKETTNTKGNTTKKYYCIIDGELYTTSKTVLDYWTLCQEVQAKSKLYIVNGKRVCKK